MRNHKRMCGMKRLITILFLFSVALLLTGGCAYYYPYDYDSYYPDNYGFIAPFYYYSPYGNYSSYPYPSSYPERYYYPSTRYYLGERPEDFRERRFESDERPGGER